MSDPRRSGSSSGGSSLFAALPRKKASTAAAAAEQQQQAGKGKQQATTTTSSPASTTPASTSPHVPTRGPVQTTLHAFIVRSPSQAAAPAAATTSPAQAQIAAAAATEIAAPLSSAPSSTTRTPSSAAYAAPQSSLSDPAISINTMSSDVEPSITTALTQSQTQALPTTQQQLPADDTISPMQIDAIIPEEESSAAVSSSSAVALPASSYDSPPSTPRLSPTAAAASPAIYVTPPKARPSPLAAQRSHGRSQSSLIGGGNFTGAMLPPPSPLRSPVNLFPHHSGGHRRAGSFAGSSIDARYLARLAAPSSGSSSGNASPAGLLSPRKSPKASPGGALAASPMRSPSDQMSLSPYPQSASGALRPRKLNMDGAASVVTPGSGLLGSSAGSGNPSPQQSPAKRKAGAMSPASAAHPSLHVFPSPRATREAAQRELIESLGGGGAAGAGGAVAAFPFSPTLTSPGSSSSTSSLDGALTPGPSTSSLASLQRKAGFFDFSDRFIPSRKESRLERMEEMRETEQVEGGSEADQENATDAAARAVALGAASSSPQPASFSPAYSLLLRSEILGGNDSLSTTGLPASMVGSSDAAREQFNPKLVLHRSVQNQTSTTTTTQSGVEGPTTLARAAGTMDIATRASGTGAASSSTSSSIASPTHSSPSSSSSSSSQQMLSPSTFRFRSPRHGNLSLQAMGGGGGGDPFTSSAAHLNSSTHRLLSHLSSSSSSASSLMGGSSRTISKLPWKVLDAPGLKDDFYLNLVDWSVQNVVAVALGRKVYLWSGATCKVAVLLQLEEEEDAVTSVRWTMRGNHLAVGLKSGVIQVWDVTKQKCISTLHGHTQRVSSLAWNSHLLASGSRDQKILLHDPRQSSQSSQSSSVGGVTAVAKLESHTSEVCGLEWSYDEHQLASGGNDNKLLIWDRNQSTPLCRFEHQAAVKALAWSPHQHGLLASGGGTADRCIRFWSTPTAEPVSHIDTGSQVCNLLWSKNVNEIVSTHGYSLNQIHVWRYPTMQQVATLVGHTKRVLYLAASPDGQTVVTGAGDDTLRFWNLWEGSSAALPSWSGDKQKGKMSQQGSCILPTAVESLIR